MVDGWTLLDHLESSPTWTFMLSPKVTIIYGQVNWGRFCSNRFIHLWADLPIIAQLRMFSKLEVVISCSIFQILSESACWSIRLSTYPSTPIDYNKTVWMSTIILSCGFRKVSSQLQPPPHSELWMPTVPFTSPSHRMVNQSWFYIPLMCHGHGPLTLMIKMMMVCQTSTHFKYKVGYISEQHIEAP